MRNKIFLGLVTLVACFGLSSCNLSFSDPKASIEVVENENTQYEELEAKVTEVVEKVSHSSIGVLTEESTSASIGSGVIYKIIDKVTGKAATAETVEGICYAVTNEHVVSTTSSSAKYQVYLGNEVYVPAKVVGTDATADLAVVKFTTNIQQYQLTAIADFYSEDITKTDIPAIGSIAIAMGSPLDFENYNYATSGIVGGVTYNEIKHSAPINPGNSGGGLFNMAGRLIGINVSKLTYVYSGTNKDGTPEYTPVVGIAYAIPVWTVRKVVSDIESLASSIVRPTLGIEAHNANASLVAGDADLLPNIINSGILVDKVTVDSSAYNATSSSVTGGIKAGDVIYMLNDENIDRIDELKYFVDLCKKGDSITLKVYRKVDSKWLDLTFKVSF